MERPLNAMEQWMVRSNLQRIQQEGTPPADTVALLRTNGYPRIAAAVEEATKTPPSQVSQEG